MIAHIVHDPKRRDRHKLLLKEMVNQRFYSQLFTATTYPNPIEGCHTSHRNIVKRAQERNRSMVLIMEDDVMFNDSGAFKYFIENIPKEPFDIYTAGVYGSSCKYNTDTGLLRRMCGTHCYIVHSSFYSAFLTMDITKHLDEQISATAKVMRMCYPMAALQHPGHSDIAGKEVDYNNPKWIAYPLYKKE